MNARCDGALERPVELRGDLSGFVTVLRLLQRSDLDDVSKAEGWSVTLSAMEGRLSARTFVKRCLEYQAMTGGLSLAVCHAGRSQIAGITCLLPMPGRCIALGRTHLRVAGWRRVTQLETKYLILRQAFETWQLDAVSLGAPSSPGDDQETEDAAEEVSTLHQLMEDTGRFDDMASFVVRADEWPMLRLRVEARIGRMLQEVWFPRRNCSLRSYQL